MNCDECRDKLVNLAYGELEASQASAVEAHLSQCPACRAELEKLRFARAALAHGRAGEPRTPPAIAATPRRARLRRYIPVGVGAAAAAVLVATLLVLLAGPGTPLLQARPSVEILRKDVSLTILSEPPQTGQTARGRTVRYGPWPGLALVRDRRLARHLPGGVTQVRFADVPAGIRPDSVRLRSPDAPGRLTILEQNYQYDLASATAVLDKTIDHGVTLQLESGDSITGTLLSHEAGALVVQPPGEGPRNVPRRAVRAVTLSELPEGLLTRPTLVWHLRNEAESRQRLEVNYLTEGLTWRADYVLKLRGPIEGAEPPEIVDAAEMVGYATVTNESGVTYADATLKLMAGDVNLVREPTGGGWGGGGLERDKYNYANGLPGFEEKSFFEYHLYTLGRKTTLRDRETKQIELATASGLKLRRRYVFDYTNRPAPSARPGRRALGAGDELAARVVSELKNSEANGLGRPLPKGVVRLYAPDPTGVSTYVGQTKIDHTPKDETLRLPWGRAFDLLCRRRLADARHSGAEHSQRRQYTIRNHKGRPVAVAIVVAVPKTTYAAECDAAWHVREVGVVEIELTVGAGASAEANLALRYNTESGGGLTSPHDAPGREHTE
jgi:hypothetical protein